MLKLLRSTIKKSAPISLFSVAFLYFIYVHQYSGVVVYKISQATATIPTVAVNTTESVPEPDFFEDNFDIFQQATEVPLSPLEQLEQLEKQIPNLPATYIEKHKLFHKSSPPCNARFPHLQDLYLNNIYYQEAFTSNGTFYLYGAYYDNRKYNKFGPLVRVLLMVDRFKPSVEMNCQLWFEGKKAPEFSKVFEYKYIWSPKWGQANNNYLQPYLVACKIPPAFKGKVPVTVSIMENKCDRPTHMLKVINNQLPEGRTEKEKVAVCVKGLTFRDDSNLWKLIEWIEVTLLMGAAKIVLYNLHITPRMSKVLDYYSERGQVEVVGLTMPGWQPNVEALRQNLFSKKKITKRQNEVVPYNDCFYRNMNLYDYITLVDVDELIMPLQHYNWIDLIPTLEETFLKEKGPDKVVGSFNFKNIYFMESMLSGQLEANDVPDELKGIPKHFHMMRHVYRSPEYTVHVKSFFNTEKVLTLHNHTPLTCISGVCFNYHVNTTMAQLQHYRSDCAYILRKRCSSVFKNGTVLDPGIWRFKEAFTNNIKKTVQDLLELGL